jgi:hypothetical protein
LVELSEKVNIKHPIDTHNIAIYADPFYPDACIIGLPLNSDPSYVWQRLFEQELWSSLDFWDRKVVIVGRELKLVTTRERVGEKLGWLEDLITATNRRVDEYNKKAKAENEATKQKFTDEEAIRKELVSWQLRRVPGVF